jgi:Transposase DDE domain
VNNRDKPSRVTRSIDGVRISRRACCATCGSWRREEIIVCTKAGITVTLPKPMTSSAKADGRFGKQDFAYVADKDAYRCPAGEKLTYHYSNVENGQPLRSYWANECSSCVLKAACTTGKERRITRAEDEHMLEAVQAAPRRRSDRHAAAA